MRKRLVPLMLVLALISSLFAASAEYAPAEAGCPSGILDGTYIPDDFFFRRTGRVTIRCERSRSRMDSLLRPSFSTALITPACALAT